MNEIIQGDCTEKMRELEENSIDLICTDPPYGIGFMGKEWDTFKPDVVKKGVDNSRRKDKGKQETAEAKDRRLGSLAGASPAMEAARYDHTPAGASKFREWFTEVSVEMLRVLKPGAFAFVCIGARQDSVSAVITAMTEAGFKTDFTSLFWTYASGFPKAANIGKLIDKRQGAIRQGAWSENHFAKPVEYETGDPITEDAKKFEGSYGGFQPKPAVEVIVVAMKPLSEKSFVDQALKNGKGLTWLDDGRIPFQDAQDAQDAFIARPGAIFDNAKHPETRNQLVDTRGRFPANLLISDLILGENSKFFSLDNWAKSLPFLHVPKPAKSEKNEQCDDLEIKQTTGGGGMNDEHLASAYGSKKAAGHNHHPTVKPLALMSYLVILGSRKGDTVLDPFTGSGTTLLAAKNLDRNYIGIEKEGEYVEITKARLKEIQTSLFSPTHKA